jgi:hypothetical protein
MQLCIKKVETKAVITVRMKLPIFSAVKFLKSFIKFFFKRLISNNFFTDHPTLLAKRASNPFSKPHPPIIGGEA